MGNSILAELAALAGAALKMEAAGTTQIMEVFFSGLFWLQILANFWQVEDTKEETFLTNQAEVLPECTPHYFFRKGAAEFPICFSTRSVIHT